VEFIGFVLTLGCDSRNCEPSPSSKAATQAGYYSDPRIRDSFLEYPLVRGVLARLDILDRNIN